MKMRLFKIVLFLFLLGTSGGFSHPLPNTVVYLNIHDTSMQMNLSVPLQDFEIAYKSKLSGQINLPKHFNSYFLEHIQIKDSNGQVWRMKFLSYRIRATKAVFVGAYKEIQFKLQFIPNKHSNLRDFTIHYDAIMHEITNHQALIYVNSDWENGIHNDSQQIGIIGLDIPSNTIYPLHISLEKGSLWKGFKSMVQLGMKHIAEGTDHLLFLFVLLLAAPLVAQQKQWVASGGMKYSIVRIVKIATAFTLGHSFTLVLSTFGLVHTDIKWVEITIALSILCTAVHSIKPIFYNQEIYIACGFGLIHGLAFASTLSSLNLETKHLILSLFGFNIGIELIQILVIILIMPWLLLLSPYPIYKLLRLIFAFLGGIAALAWALERSTGYSNIISRHLPVNPLTSITYIAFFACFSVLYLLAKKTIVKYFN